jgi:hypothetical protein
MAFPATILDRVVLMTYGGVQNDISSLVYQRDPITISRGRSGENAITVPAQCSLTLDNRDGRFSPRNPAGALFGKIGRNTPIEVGVRLGHRFLALDGVGADYISAPDSAGLSVTGDLDVRIDVTLDDWRAPTDLAGKYGSAGQRSWAVQLFLGRLQLTWSTDGTTLIVIGSRVEVPWPQTGRCSLRATLDVNNGSGGYTVTFYYSLTPGVAGVWSQLGAPVVVTTGTTSVFDSTAAVLFGSATNASAPQQPGRLHAAELRNGIGGTVVASPTLAGQAQGAASFSDGTNTWTVGGGGVGITNYRPLFSGEIPDWPVERDTSGKDLYVPIEAAGVLRRLGQGASPLQSTLRRALPSIGAHLRGYWPLEDGERAESAVSALATGRPMTWGAPAPQLAQFTGFDGSAPLPLANGARMRGVIRTYATTGSIQTRFLLAVPAGGAADGAVVMRLATAGGVARFDLTYITATGGKLTLTAHDGAGTLLGTLGPFAIAADGKIQMISVELVQTGADVAMTLSAVEAGRTAGAFISGNLTSENIESARAITMNANGLLTDTAVGHVTVESAITPLFTFGRPLGGWVGEAAGRRVERLCAEVGVAFVPLGDLDESAQLGPQKTGTLLDLLRECEEADGGTLLDARGRLAVAYRPLGAAYSPGTRLTLAGGSGVGGDLLDIRSTDDDQYTRNDVAVARRDGSSARVEDTTSDLSTAAPPAGVGRYDEGLTMSLLSDAQLEDQASWRVHLGTVDEPRFPRVAVSLARSPLVADAAKTSACLDLDVGDSLTVASPGVALPKTDIRQAVLRTVHTLGSHDVQVDWLGAPASGYDVGIFDHEYPGEESRYSSDGSTVSGAHAAGTTSLSVATPTGPLWSSSDGAFAVEVPATGERMTVSAVAGASTPQTFTVTRGVQGTTAKALAGGEAVALARPVYWGL